MKMSTYKLTYFNCKGRAEVCRLIFAQAGVEYEDVRLPFTMQDDVVQSEEWTALKPTTPFGQLPILEVDGVTLCQTKSIARFLARRFNLAGKTGLDQARVDMLVDCFEDALQPMFDCFHEKDEARKEEATKKYTEEQLPASLVLLDKLMQANKGGDGYFVGSELTWADLNFIEFCRWIGFVGAESQLDNYPKLSALRDRVRKLPKIAEWIAKRPVTVY